MEPTLIKNKAAFISGLLLFLFFSACSTIKNGQDQFLISFSDSTEHYGFKDQEGNIVIAPGYQFSFTDTFNGAIAFVIDSTKGLIAIDKKGNYVLSPLMADNGPDYLNEGLFRFVENNKVGFADESGKKVIPAKYIFVSEFSNGRANFCIDCKGLKEGEITLYKGGKWGYINRKGEEVIRAAYNAPSYFEEGKAQVQTDSLAFYIDTLGRKVK